MVAGSEAFSPVDCVTRAPSGVLQRIDANAYDPHSEHLDFHGEGNTWWFAGKSYDRMTGVKNERIHELLVNGTDVIFLDADVAVPFEPLSFMVPEWGETVDEAEGDLLGSCEFPGGDLEKYGVKEELCVGTMLVRSHPTTIALWEAVIEEARRVRERGQFSFDQLIVNRLAKQRGLSVRCLPKYLGGTACEEPKFGDRCEWWKGNPCNVWALHANCRRQIPLLKRLFLMRTNAWFVEDAVVRSMPEQPEELERAEL